MAKSPAERQQHKRMRDKLSLPHQLHWIPGVYVTVTSLHQAVEKGWLTDEQLTRNEHLQHALKMVWEAAAAAVDR
jgi:hypothetical protein